jgi:tetratricopeptide (TPR) repeat protein
VARLCAGHEAVKKRRAGSGSFPFDRGGQFDYGTAAASRRIPVATKGKFTRKELKGPDEFISFAGKGLEWIAAHLRPLLIGVGAIAVIGSGIWIWQHFSHRSSLEASDALQAALEIYRRPLKGERGGEDEGDAKKPFENAKERAKAALEKFQYVVREFSGTDVARLGHLYVGNCHFTLGETAAAIESFEKFVSKAPEPHLQALALENIGYAYEQKKDPTKAREAFEKLTSGKVNPERGFYHLARLHAAKGDKAKAKEMYQKALDLAKKEKNDWFATEVETKIALIELEP